MLTVLLATRNRETLKAVLDAYCCLQSPPGGWKLVVVDNASTDNTPAVIVSFLDRLPLQTIREEHEGKNYALNAGLHLIEGDLVVFTDDDAFPKPDWLLRLREAANRQPSCSMFGGAIVPRWEVPPPEWIQWIDDPGPVFTLTNPSLKEGPVVPWLIFGPNMAIRAGVFQDGVRFDESMGPRGGSYPMGSETELVLRLAREGHKAWHVDGAVVEHFIRREQLDQRWILDRAVRWGRGRFRLYWKQERLWFGIPRHLFRDMPKEAFHLAAAWLSLRRDAAFRAKWRFLILRGKAIEARIMAQQGLTTGQEQKVFAESPQAR